MVTCCPLFSAERERLAGAVTGVRAAAAREGCASLDVQEHTWEEQVKKARGSGLPKKR